MRTSSFNNRPYADKPGYLVAVILLLVFSIMGYGFEPPVALQSDYGICFPSINGWQMPVFLSWMLNFLTLGICSVIALWLNSVFRFIHDHTMLFASIFLVLTGANPWLTYGFGSPAAFTLVMLIGTAILFAHHGSRNASTGLFLAFSTFAIGSMFEYAFALMIPIYIIASMYIVELRIKQLTAIILGIISPYWIALGFGLIEPSDIRMPDLNSIFFAGFIDRIPLSTMLSVALASLFTLMMALNNALTVFASNSQTRAYNSIFNLVAVALFWYMLFDFSNFTTYLPLFFLMTGIQTSHFFNITPIRHASLFIGSALAIVITLFCLSLYA